MPATSSQWRRLRPSPSTPVATPPSRSGSVPGTTPNRKRCLSTFSAQTSTSLRGVPRTCPAYRGMSPSSRWIFGSEPDPPSGAKKGDPLCVEIGCASPHQKFSIKKGLLRSPGYVRSRVSRSERGYMKMARPIEPRNSRTSGLGIPHSSPAMKNDPTREATLLLTS